MTKMYHNGSPEYIQKLVDEISRCKEAVIEVSREMDRTERRIDYALPDRRKSK